MKQIPETYNKWKSLIEGAGTALLGILLILFGNSVPRLGYTAFLTYLFFTALWNLISRWFQKPADRENLLITLAKIILASILINSVLAQNLAVYLIVLVIAFYQVFTATISLITWFLYRSNAITPRFRYLFDALLMAGFGLYSISPLHDAANFELMLLGFYLLVLGISNIRDGIFFDAYHENPKLKRRMRVSLPIFVTALIPINTLRKVNAFLATNTDESAEQAYDRIKTGKTVEIEVFIHTSESSLPLAIGHVDICYQRKVISFGSYDPTSERLFGTIGDGVLFKADREKYIELCKTESQKTLFGYGLDLTEEQEKAIQERLAEIDQLLIPWEPSKETSLDKEGKPQHTYSYLLQRDADAQLYKFKSSKFKTYFVLSTNCVLLADSIIGRAGTDILSPQGFIAPGTYQDYLDKEYDKPNSLVVSKLIY